MANSISVERIGGLFSYDHLTGEILSRHGRRIGTIDAEGYVRVRLWKGASAVRAHRLAFVAMLGRWPIGDVDHINGIRSDNRWRNLREVDRSTNAENQRAAKSTNPHGLLGVSFDTKRMLWRAQITVKGRNRNLGLYASKEMAHEVYLRAKRQLHSGCTI